MSLLSGLDTSADTASFRQCHAQALGWRQLSFFRITLLPLRVLALSGKDTQAAEVAARM
jgi:hypothetical protein